MRVLLHCLKVVTVASCLGHMHTNIYPLQSHAAAKLPIVRRTTNPTAKCDKMRPRNQSLPSCCTPLNLSLTPTRTYTIEFRKTIWPKHILIFRKRHPCTAPLGKHIFSKSV
jgi:hypothetical protein